MDRILEARLDPMFSYLVDSLPLSTLIQCYESSPEFRSLAKRVLAEVDDWPLILSTFEVPVALLKDFQDILPWDFVVRQQNLSKETVEMFKHRIKWNHSSAFVNTPFEILRDFVDQPNFSWYHFCRYVELPAEYIEENSEKVDWEAICCYQILSEEFLTENAHQLHWYSVSIRQRLSEKFIAEHADKLNWPKLCRHQLISINLMREFPNKIDWPSIISTQVITDDVLEEFKDQIDWTFLMMGRQRLSESQILKYEAQVDWSRVARCGELSFDFIKKNLHRLVWDDVIRCQCLPYEFLEDHIEFIDWNILSENNRLPLLFIENYLENLNLFSLVMRRSFSVAFIESVLLKAVPPRLYKVLWYAISHYDTLNEEFIHKYREKLDWVVLCKRQKFEENFIADHHEYVHWPSVCSRQKLSPSFLLRFKEYVCWPIVLVKPHISRDFIHYITDNYVDMGTVLEYYNNLKSFEKLHRIHCPTISNHRPHVLSSLEIGEQLLDYYDDDEIQLNKIFVWYLKLMSTHGYDGLLCSSFKTCRGCSLANCKSNFCTYFDNFVEEYINHIYDTLVKGIGSCFIYDYLG